MDSRYHKDEFGREGYITGSFDVGNRTGIDTTALHRLKKSGMVKPAIPSTGSGVPDLWWVEDIPYLLALMDLKDFMKLQGPRNELLETVRDHYFRGEEVCLIQFGRLTLQIALTEDISGEL